MISYNPADATLSTRAFEKVVLPTMKSEKFSNTEQSRMDYEELTDWITESGLRFEHKHSEGALKGFFVMRAYRHNGESTDLLKFATLVVQNKVSILSVLAFTRTFGDLNKLRPGDYDRVSADSLVEYLSIVCDEIFGFEGAIRELTKAAGIKHLLDSGVVDSYAKPNAVYIKIPLADLA